MFGRLLSKLARGNGVSLDDVAKPGGQLPFDQHIASRAAEISADAGADEAATARTVLTHLVQAALSRTEIDPRQDKAAVAVVLTVYAAGIPMQRGLARCGTQVELSKLLGGTSRDLLESHHGDEARQAIVRQATDAFQNRRKREENLAHALETAGNMAFGWFTTGDDTYRDGLAESARQLASAV